jgi:membrane protein required for colicin V production
MSYFDFVIAGLMTLFIGIGALRGVWRESLSLGVWLVAILCGWLFADAVGTWFDALKDDDTRRLIAFLAIVLVALATLTLLMFVLRLLLPRPEPDTKSRVFGALLGTLRGGAVVTMLVLLAGLTALPRQDSWKDSQLVGIFVPAARQMLEWMPSAVAGQFRYS